MLSITVESLSGCDRKSSFAPTFVRRLSSEDIQNL
ncbi:hypothetical protein FOZG_17315 [Fusarium oxysporum Fo47]|uniref:Uncharacterized protein n=1 Tax=Fusarium oxysporum Fo47 TaxID=660027 RepID=W9JAD7_FUSOX|nr:hypothetical protein FOZG_17315 [Fusarium oxysporum Fo47]